MLATAFLYSGHYEPFAEMLGTLDQLSPETPEDYLFLGAAFVPGHRNHSAAGGGGWARGRQLRPVARGHSGSVS